MSVIFVLVGLFGVWLGSWIISRTESNELSIVAGLMFAAVSILPIAIGLVLSCLRDIAIYNRDTVQAIKELRQSQNLQHTESQVQSKTD